MVLGVKTRGNRESVGGKKLGVPQRIQQDLARLIGRAVMEHSVGYLLVRGPTPTDITDVPPPQKRQGVPQKVQFMGLVLAAILEEGPDLRDQDRFSVMVGRFRDQGQSIGLFQIGLFPKIHQGWTASVDRTGTATARIAVKMETVDDVRVEDWKSVDPIQSRSRKLGRRIIQIDPAVVVPLNDDRVFRPGPDHGKDFPQETEPFLLGLGIPVRLVI